MRVRNAGERRGRVGRQRREGIGVVAQHFRGICRAAVKMEVARRFRRNACINGSNLGAQLQRIEIDWACDGHDVLLLFTRSAEGQSGYTVWVPSSPEGMSSSPR